MDGKYTCALLTIFQRLIMLLFGKSAFSAKEGEDGLFIVINARDKRNHFFFSVLKPV